MSLLSYPPPVGVHQKGKATADPRWKKTHVVAELLSNFFSASVFKSFVFLQHLSSPSAVIYPTSLPSHIHHVLELTCSWVTGMSRCLDSSRRVLTSVLMSSLQPTSTTLALGQNSCVSPCHWRTTEECRNTAQVTLKLEGN